MFFLCKRVIFWIWIICFLVLWIWVFIWFSKFVRVIIVGEWGVFLIMVMLLVIIVVNIRVIIICGLGFCKVIVVFCRLVVLMIIWFVWFFIVVFKIFRVLIRWGLKLGVRIILFCWSIRGLVNFVSELFNGWFVKLWVVLIFRLVFVVFICVLICFKKWVFNVICLFVKGIWFKIIFFCDDSRVVVWLVIIVFGLFVRVIVLFSCFLFLILICIINFFYSDFKIVDRVVKKLVKKFVYVYLIVIVIKMISRGKFVGGWWKKCLILMFLIVWKVIKIKLIWIISVIKVFNFVI